MRALNLTGEKFGRLTVLSKTENRGEKTAWLCVCECGNSVIAGTTALRRGNTKSCGCLLSEKRTKHGMCGSKLYRAWNNMLSRCYCETMVNYPNYGGRGITVCEEWRKSFEAFKAWSLLNGYKEHLTIDRIEVNGNYEPSNCRWITNKEQQNNRRNNRYITFKNETHTIKEWSEITGVHHKTLAYRIDRGWDLEKAMTRGAS